MSDDNALDDDGDIETEVVEQAAPAPVPVYTGMDRGPALLREKPIRKDVLARTSLGGDGFNTSEGQRVILTDPKRVAALERRLRALDLRKAGLTYQQIAKTMNLTRREANSLVTQALRELWDKSVDVTDELRQLELARYETITLKLWPRVLEGQIPAIETFLRVSKARREMMGLDVPVQVDVTSGGEPIGASVDRIREDILRRLNRRASSAGADEANLLTEG